MIKDKNDLIEYLNEDKRIMNTTRKKPSLHQVCWKYLILLRKTEYYTKTPLKKSFLYVNKYKIKYVC